MEKPSIRPVVLGVFAGAGFVGSVAEAQDFGAVVAEQKIAAATGGFSGALDNRDQFGQALAAIGDVDGDGVGDLAVGVPEDDDGGLTRGAVWILFLTPAGTVRQQAKISSTQGGFAGPLDDADRFGSAVAGLGDLDGDGQREVAVAAELDDDGGLHRGAVWVLSLARNGAVAKAAKISQTSGGFTGALRDGDRFGHSLATLDDLDGDGARELAVGATLDRDGGTGRGAVWLLFLNTAGGVKGHTKISSVTGGFLGPLRDGDRFGKALASLGDLDGDGLSELAVGADQDDDGGTTRGAAWILFLRPDGSVRAQSKLSSVSGLVLDNHDHFGASLAAPGDLDGDGMPDLVVGAPFDDDGSMDRGASWVLFLASDGSLAGWRKISALEGDFTGPLPGSAWFGTALAAVGDLGGDDSVELVVGTIGDDTGGQDRGAAWVLSLETAVADAMLVRNGLGVNPVILSADEPPAIGETWWEVRVDCSGFHRGIAMHIVTGAPLDGPVIGRRGQLLVDWRLTYRRLTVPHRGGVTTLRHRVPRDPALVGLPIYTQAFVTGRGGAKFTNALDGVVVQAP